MKIKLSPAPVNRDEKEKIRVLAGYYKGICVFHKNGIIEIKEKDGFNRSGFISTLLSMKYKIMIE